MPICIEIHVWRCSAIYNPAKELAIHVLFQCRILLREELFAEKPALLQFHTLLRLLTSHIKYSEYANIICCRNSATILKKSVA